MTPGKLSRILCQLAALAVGYLIYWKEASPIWLTVAAGVAWVFSTAGAMLLRARPILGLTLIELRSVTYVAVIALSYWLAFWVATWFTKASDDVVAVQVVVGTIGSLVATIFLKGHEPDGGWLGAGRALRMGLASAYEGAELCPSGDCAEVDAISEWIVRETEHGASFEGWGLEARWKRAGILSTYLQRQP